MMKPDFALDLSFERITLLHDAGGGDWDVVGEVALDGGNLAGDLAALRRKALALAPSGMATRLIIPDEQIRYLDIPAASAPHGDHDAAAAAALDGATPYPLHELAYDWTVSGARLQIAAVARETLAEAEAFAVEHDFNPVCLVARPEAGMFDGEPFFGPTAAAEAAGMAVRDDAAPKADEQAPATDAALLFSTIRGAPDATAPRLDGVTRFTPAPPLPEDELRALSVGATASLAPLDMDPSEAEKPVDAQRVPPPEAAPDRAPLAAPRPASGPEADRDPAATPAIPAPLSEAERLTIFGARKAEEARRGKPRFLGLILTAALVLLMIGVAALAAIFPDTGLGRLFRGAEPQIAVTPEIPELTIVMPEQVPSPLASGLLAPEVGPEIAAVPEPVPEPEIDTLPPAQASAPAPASAPEWQAPRTPEEARARYAATGIWPQAPDPPAEPPRDSLESFYQTSIDEALAFGDAVALPRAEDLGADAPPPTPTLPPPPGRVFKLDARGFVEATPEGTLTPDGVLVRAGPPPLRPQTMPVRAVPVPGVEPTAEAIAARERLSRIRPRPRPGNLTEQQERGALGGRSRTELAALRPRLRPSGLAPPAADTAAIDAALAEAAEQAVIASLKPRLRPQTIARAAPARAAATAIAPATEEDEPEPTRAAAAAPRIPSSASVAQQATTRNAINLRQVNLIGVYGTPTNRRALVRLANGRYQKVQVGDRIDGGRVSAIGDGELRYNKRGRDVVLRLPRG